MKQKIYEYKHQNPTDNEIRNAGAEGVFIDLISAELSDVCKRAKDAGYTDEEINAALNSAAAKLFYCF